LQKHETTFAQAPSPVKAAFGKPVSQKTQYFAHVMSGPAPAFLYIEDALSDAGAPAIMLEWNRFNEGLFGGEF
jgi:hypothetical protein